MALYIRYILYKLHHLEPNKHRIMCCIRAARLSEDDIFLPV
jgi:hypothetical protein